VTVSDENLKTMTKGQVSLVEKSTAIYSD